jgi:hypothetical protein
VTRAKDYVAFILQQRVGPVAIDPNLRRDDLSIVRVPTECVGFVMGRGGAVLRDVEEEWGTLMFFAEPKDSGASSSHRFPYDRVRVVNFIP